MVLPTAFRVHESMVGIMPIWMVRRRPMLHESAQPTFRHMFHTCVNSHLEFTVHVLPDVSASESPGTKQLFTRNHQCLLIEAGFGETTLNCVWAHVRAADEALLLGDTRVQFLQHTLQTPSILGFTSTTV